jgi:metal iron transporter
MILLSNVFAIFLQSLCVKLGTVTGMNLAENCKAHLPRWLNYVLYAFAEAAIIATDIAEVYLTAASVQRRAIANMKYRSLAQQLPSMYFSVFHL